MSIQLLYTNTFKGLDKINDCGLSHVRRTNIGIRKNSIEDGIY